MDDWKARLPKGLYTFVPAFGEHVYTNCFQTVGRLCGLMTGLDVPMELVTKSYPDITELRNIAFSVWYYGKPHLSHMLYIDADMGFPEKMVLDMIMLDEPFVGCTYPVKNPDGEPKSFVFRRYPNKRYLESGNGGHFQEMEGVGFGCTLIRRDCADRMVAFYPELITGDDDPHAVAVSLRKMGIPHLARLFNQAHDMDGVPLAEDYSFCERWLGCGGKVWAAANYDITHMGPHIWKGNFMKDLA